MNRREVMTSTGSTGAIYSDCETYRYLLWRVWDDSLPRALMVMMNPSTANEVENDPTVERQIRRVLMWPRIGFPLRVGGLEVANAFAYREVYSRRLAGLHMSGLDLVGPDNDAMILEASRRAAIVICGWGKPGMLCGRGNAVLRLLRAAGIRPYGLQMNRDGTPRHPLYVGYKTIPTRIPT